jgi:hypothetical protein
MTAKNSSRVFAFYLLLILYPECLIPVVWHFNLWIYRKWNWHIISTVHKGTRFTEKVASCDTKQKENIYCNWKHNSTLETFRRIMPCLDWQGKTKERDQAWLHPNPISVELMGKTTLQNSKTATVQGLFFTVRWLRHKIPPSTRQESEGDISRVLRTSTAGSCRRKNPNVLIISKTIMIISKTMKFS